MELPLTTSATYILEEYERSESAPMTYAWSFKTEEEAINTLLTNIRMHGHTHMYSLYISIEK